MVVTNGMLVTSGMLATASCLTPAVAVMALTTASVLGVELGRGGQRHALDGDAGGGGGQGVVVADPER